MVHRHLEPALLEHLRRLSTCVVASAIETFDVRLPNVGFADSRVRCIFPELPAIIGYAATARVRSSLPPMGGGTYYGRTNWWNAILEVPAPRIVVLQDADQPPGLGAFVGEVHANALQALRCAGLVTNGGVRDLQQVRAIPFQMFAGNVAISHAYAHISGFGQPVEVGGLTIHPGDLLLGDLHGVISIPMEVAGDIPCVAEKILRLRHEMVGLCRSEDFTIEKLRATAETAGSIRHHEHEREENDTKRGGS
jgi:4-hydroxy-4-methyl-2-oxoglutarate aldolase